MHEDKHFGFIWKIEHIRHGRVLSVERIHNLMPVEAINHMLNTEFRAGTPITTWYVAPFEGNYTPVSGDTMAARSALNRKPNAISNHGRK